MRPRRWWLALLGIGAIALVVVALRLRVAGLAKRGDAAREAAAAQDVQAALNAATNLLPRTRPSSPTYSRSNPADTPILTLAASSCTPPLAQVDDQADSILAPKITQVVGVGLVTLNGRQEPAVRVQVDLEALAGRDLTLEGVRAAPAAANVHQPTGNLDGPRQNHTRSTNDQLADAAGSWCRRCSPSSRRR